jgi:DNA helicase-2/ATP-dependent DNA helicase PcrA
MVNYTDAQLEAINTLDKNLQITACAGSGKTQVIAARIVEALKLEGVKPQNIVAFTFTDKAAAELKDRIADLISNEFGEVVGLAEMYVGTIHGYCLQLLQTFLFAEYLKYSVITQVQGLLLVARNSKKSGLTSTEIISGPKSGETLSRKSSDVRIFIEALNILREDRVSWDQLPQGLTDAYDRYASLLDEKRYLDFSTIQLQAVTALYDKTDPSRLKLQEVIRDRVKFLVVDEYQDVNPIQESLIHRIYKLGANICVVGDDDQTIYQWRGSDITNILTFAQRYQSVHTVTLAENFRSSPGVVDVARQIAAQNDPNRLPKHMIAGGHQTFALGDILACSFNEPAEEALWIVQKIKDLIGVPFQDENGEPARGLSYSDMAVLLRSVRRNGGPIVGALRAAGIPYVITGMTNLFDSEEVNASVISFLYLVGASTEDNVRDAWHAANLGLSNDNISNGVRVLNAARDWNASERWSSYNIQRTFLDLLEAMGVREERIPPTSAGAARGEIVFFNLGKFSQAISDFEQIYFHSKPQEKYTTFALWLQRDAPDLYEEGGDSSGYAQPDAVQLLTVHQSKGMEWPVVFIPALQANRFPATGGSKGRSKWHILPRASVPNAARYDGSVGDERRLFYVALTRSKKYLYCSFAPITSNQLYRRASEFLRDMTGIQFVLTRDAGANVPAKLQPRARKEVPKVVLSFSELKYFFQCPYQFKLRFLYGFNAPIHEALGYGKSIHDTLAEVHKRAINQDLVTKADAQSLVEHHLHTPFAYPTLAEQLRKAAIESVERYLDKYGSTLDQTIHSEQQIEIHIEPGITVSGRVDLIKRLDTGETSIIDFKSTERAQAEEVTRAQLHTYAMGYRELTGKDADMIEILNLDKAGLNTREKVDVGLVKETQNAITNAGAALRQNTYQRLIKWCEVCASCDYSGICRDKQLMAKGTDNADK